jgi:hypothetical protein
VNEVALQPEQLAVRDCGQHRVGELALRPDLGNQARVPLGVAGLGRPALAVVTARQ